MLAVYRCAVRPAHLLDDLPGRGAGLASVSTGGSSDPGTRRGRGRIFRGGLGRGSAGRDGVAWGRKAAAGRTSAVQGSSTREESPLAVRTCALPKSHVNHLRQALEFSGCQGPLGGGLQRGARLVGVSDHLDLQAPDREGISELAAGGKAGGPHDGVDLPGQRCAAAA